MARGGVDALGTRHAPAGPEARIVALVPSITELLFDLGLGERVVGRTTFCVHPAPAVTEVPRVGGTKKPDLERLRAVRPTHVIVNVDENRREDVEAIARFVPHVVVTHPLAPADNLSLYALLGGIFRRQAEAGALAARLHAALAELERQRRCLPPRQVLYLIWQSPWMTVSRTTYISRMLALVNWETVGHDPERRYPEVTLDAGLLDGTDLVLLSSEPFPFKPRHAAAMRRELAGWTGLEVELIDGELVSWYGSRAIAGVSYLGDLAKRLGPPARRPSQPGARGGPARRV